MTFLVTGGMGINGSHVARKLVEQGERPVLYDIGLQTEMISDITERVKIVRGNILDYAELLRTIKREEIDYIIHAAWVNVDRNELDTPMLNLRVNVEGTLNVLEAGRIFDMEKIVFFSSCRIYDRIIRKPVDEDYPKTPKAVYSAAKVLCEAYGEGYADKYGINFIALRFPPLFGPGRLICKPYPVGRFVDKIVVNAVNGEPILVSEGDEKLENLYLKDMANAVFLACHSKKEVHRIFNIGSGEYLTLREIATIIKRFIPGATVEDSSGMHGPSAPFLNFKRAQRELGYKPNYSMEEAVKDYLKWLGYKQKD